jgi:hypothetical protein
MVSLTRARLATLLLVAAASLATLSLTGCSGNSAASSSTTAAAAGANSPGSNPANGTTGAPVSSSNSTASSHSSGGSSADINACSLLSAARASKLVGKYPYSGSTPATIAPGQDQCTYANTGPLPDMIVIIYQPNSGVSFSTLTSTADATTSVPGVGDKAMSGGIELDVEAGNKIIAIQAAGGIGYGGSFTGAIAVAKALIAALG